MIKKGVYRVPNGKTIRVCLEYEDEKIKTIVFTGDFFIEPDYITDELGKHLSGVKISKDEITNRVLNFFKSKKNVWIYGAKPIDFANAIIKTVNL
jgi:hypothetical protein